MTFLIEDALGRLVPLLDITVPVAEAVHLSQSPSSSVPQMDINYS